MQKHWASLGKQYINTPYVYTHVYICIYVCICRVRDSGLSVGNDSHAEEKISSSEALPYETRCYLKPFKYLYEGCSRDHCNGGAIGNTFPHFL